MSTIFTDNDARLLNKTLQIREQLIDNILAANLPITAKNIDSFTNLLESVDRSILGKAKIKIEDVNSKTNEETKNMLKNFLLDLHRDVNASYNNSSVTIEPQEYKALGINVLEGELIPKVDNIDVKSILEK